MVCHVSRYEETLRKNYIKFNSFFLYLHTFYMSFLRVCVHSHSTYVRKSNYIFHSMKNIIEYIEETWATNLRALVLMMMLADFHSQNAHSKQHHLSRRNDDARCEALFFIFPKPISIVQLCWIYVLIEYL